MSPLKRAALAAGAALLLLLLQACVAPLDAPPPTYHDDIAPLFAQSCLPCHGEQSPHHGLASYTEVVEHAERALSLMRSGAMPKGNVDRSGACGEFTAPAPVGEADIELFARFVDHGMPEGELAAGATEPMAPAWPDASAVAGSVVSVASEPYLPAVDAEGGSGDHRCFVLSGMDADADADADADQLRAFRVLPTQPELVHHVMLFALDAQLDASTARELDRAAAGPGWPCFGTPGIPAARLVGVWTPGRDVVRLPEGYATRLGRAGLLVQVHYDGPPPSGPSSVRFELELADGSERELRFVPFAAVNLVLPPGSERVRTEHRGWLGLTAGSELLGVYPHMHALGRRLSLHAALGPGDVEPSCLVDVPRWDYAFQELALYRAPMRVDVDDPQLSIACEHDTRSADRVVRWGERMEDEMCMVFLATAAAR